MSDSKMIYKSINDVMKEVGAVSKSQKNQAQGFMFRGIDLVYNSLHNHMGEKGVFSVPRVLDRVEEQYENAKGTKMYRVVLKVEYDFTAIDGSFVTVGPVFGEAFDSGDKATNKAFSIAHKYALLQLFMIPTEDDKDPDAHTVEIPKDMKQTKTTYNHAPMGPGKPSEAQIKRLFAIAKANFWAPADIKQLMKEELKIESTNDLMLEQYEKLIDYVSKNKPADAGIGAPK